MPDGIAGRAKDVPKMTVEVLDVRIAAQGKAVLSKTKRLKHYAVVERL